MAKQRKEEVEEDSKGEAVKEEEEEEQRKASIGGGRRRKMADSDSGDAAAGSLRTCEGTPTHCHYHSLLCSPSLTRCSPHLWYFSSSSFTFSPLPLLLPPPLPSSWYHGIPPIPRARSSFREPVDITGVDRAQKKRLKDNQKRKENGSTAIFASTKTKNFSIVLATIKTKNLNKPHPLYHRSILVFCKMAKVVIYQVTQKHYNPNLTKIFREQHRDISVKVSHQISIYIVTNNNTRSVNLHLNRPAIRKCGEAVNRCTEYVEMHATERVIFPAKGRMHTTSTHSRG
ncbi:hypothetical protein C4D60_Mb01t14840 [Musa balbisiana]|uniref:Uncharacterized protein n=1 Tax=Musa balbisiana TaxID=52838 RepID=A0A4S8JMB3_MUSBA|nr:hypothetical protein C4D60_Mb01t14840 [Musa balbisiana]